MQDHLRVSCLIDNVFQTTLSDLEVNGESGAQAVETLLGLAGKTPGNAKLDMSGTLTVPVTGPETDIAGSVARGSYHEVQIPIGDKTIVSQGWFDSFSLKGSVGSSTTYSFKYTGDFPPPS